MKYGEDAFLIGLYFPYFILERLPLEEIDLLLSLEKNIPVLPKLWCTNHVKKLNALSAFGYFFSFFVLLTFGTSDDISAERGSLVLKDILLPSLVPLPQASDMW